MDSNRHNYRSVQRLKRHLKYPYQRVEQRQNNVDETSIVERTQMEKLSKAKISIGTFTFLKPKPESKISTFTLAFSIPIPKNELYTKLHQAFNDHWDGEPIKSVSIHLSKPFPLSELRKKLRDNFEDLFQTQNLNTNTDKI